MDVAESIHALNLKRGDSAMEVATALLRRSDNGLIERDFLLDVLVTLEDPRTEAERERVRHTKDARISQLFEAQRRSGTSYIGLQTAKRRPGSGRREVHTKPTVPSSHDAYIPRPFNGSTDALRLGRVLQVERGVLITGPPGIGRLSLVRHLAAENGQACDVAYPCDDLQAAASTCATSGAWLIVRNAERLEPTSWDVLTSYVEARRCAAEFRVIPIATNVPNFGAFRRFPAVQANDTVHVEIVQSIGLTEAQAVEILQLTKGRKLVTRDIVRIAKDVSAGLTPAEAVTFNTESCMQQVTM